MPPVTRLMSVCKQTKRTSKGNPFPAHPRQVAGWWLLGMLATVGRGEAGEAGPRSGRGHHCHSLQLAAAAGGCTLLPCNLKRWWRQLQERHIHRLQVELRPTGVQRLHEAALPLRHKQHAQRRSCSDVISVMQGAAIGVLGAWQASRGFPDQGAPRAATRHSRLPGRP